MKRTGCILLIFLVLTARGRAAESPLAPFLDERTVAVLRVDLTKFDVEALGNKLRALAGPLLESDDLPPGWIEAIQALKRAGVSNLAVVVSLADVPERLPFLVLEPPAGKKDEVLRVLRKVAGLGGAEAMGTVVVAGEPATRARLKALKATPRPEIAPALDALPAGLVRLVVVPTTDTVRILEETIPVLPGALGGGPVGPLARGLRWLGVSASVAPQARVELVVQARDGASAKALAGVWKKGLEVLVGNEVLKKEVPWLLAWLTGRVPQVMGDRLRLSLTEKQLQPLLKPLAAQAGQSRAEARMRRLVVALLAYEAKHGRFPVRASFDKDGAPLLSWRVHLLPFLGERALYGEFRLDEAWDSPHNKKLLAKMPAVFRPASAKLAATFKTPFLVPVGANTLFPPRRGVAVREVTGGLNNTIALVEVADEQAVEWTRPADLPFDAKKPLVHLARRDPAGLLLGLADGSVERIPAGTEPSAVRGRFLRAGRH